MVAVLGLAVALGVTHWFIRYANKNHLFDTPDHRKLHKQPTPTMGGIGIISGLMFAMIVLPFVLPVSIKVYFVLLGIVTLAITGGLDDRLELSPKIRLMIQFLVAVIATVSGYCLESLHGFLGIYELPLWIAYPFTIVMIIGITNAFNLIDGIDGLAGSLGFIILTTGGILLVYAGGSELTWPMFAIAGSISGFLWYNWSPAKIFMGDTGSLPLGYLISLMSIELFSKATLFEDNNFGNFIILVAIIFPLIPAYDTIRVSIGRIKKGKSPFDADRTHLHHLLIKTEMSHAESTKSIVGALIILSSTAWFLRFSPLSFSILLIIIMTIFMYELILLRKIYLANQAIRERKRNMHQIAKINRFVDYESFYPFKL